MADRLRIVSVNVARPSVLLQYDGGEVISAIDKRPTSAPTLQLDALNLEGDEQADQRPTPSGGQVHGGPDQAVYMYPVEHYPALERLVGRKLAHGFMGENVTVAGATEQAVCIGDRWQWGSAVLEVTAPRGPCYKLGIRMGKQAARTVVREEQLVGWYLRVLVPGTVPTTGVINRISRDEAGLTVAAVQAAINDRSNAYPDMAAHRALSKAAAFALSHRGRDITGGVPESDG